MKVLPHSLIYLICEHTHTIPCTLTNSTKNNESSDTFPFYRKGIGGWSVDEGIIGLKFAPTPRKIPDPLEFFERYYQQCRRQYNTLINISASNPLPNIIDEHLTQIKSRLEDITKLKSPEEKSRYWHNLSKDHQEALSKLRKDKTITIKPADKGTCIVIQDTKTYLEEGLRELQDVNTYQEIQEDTYQETARQANQLVADYHFEKKLLSVFEKTKYTTNLTEVRPQRLYWLRKVHKSPNQLRPIVSCCSGPTQKLSQLCNSYLRDYLQNVPSLDTSSTEVVRVLNSFTSLEKAESHLSWLH